MLAQTSIKRDHLIKAMSQLHSKGDASTLVKYVIPFEVNGRLSLLQPKQIISLAGEYAQGEKIPLKRFRGGKQTNTFLQKYGFKVSTLAAPEKISIKVAASQPKCNCWKAAKPNPNCQKHDPAILKNLPFSPIWKLSLSERVLDQVKAGLWQARGDYQPLWLCDSEQSQHHRVITAGWRFIPESARKALCSI